MVVRAPNTLGPHHGRNEDGSAAVEVLIFAGLTITGLGIMFAIGSANTAIGRVADSAHDAARAATKQQTAAAASQAAHQAITDNIGDNRNGLCETQSVGVDVHDFRAGGAVTVTVTCSVRLSEVFLPGIPGSFSTTGRSTSPVDTYRSKP